MVVAGSKNPRQAQSRPSIPPEGLALPDYYSRDHLSGKSWGHAVSSLTLRFRGLLSADMVLWVGSGSVASLGRGSPLC